MGAAAVVRQSCWQFGVRLGPGALGDVVERRPALGDTSSAMARLTIRRLGHGLGDDGCHGLYVHPGVGAAGVARLWRGTVGVHPASARAFPVRPGGWRNSMACGKPAHPAGRPFRLRANFRLLHLRWIDMAAKPRLPGCGCESAP